MCRVIGPFATICPHLAMVDRLFGRGDGAMTFDRKHDHLRRTARSRWRVLASFSSKCELPREPSSATADASPIAPCSALHDVISDHQGVAAKPGDQPGPPQRLRLLLDTNVFIAVEPFYGSIEAGLARGAALVRLASEQGHTLWCIPPHEMISVKAEILTGVDNVWQSFRSIRCSRSVG